MNQRLAKIILVIFIFLWPIYTAFAQLNIIPCPSGLNCSLGTSGVNGLILRVINWLVGFAFGLAVLFLVIGGFQYIISGGNVESSERAKGTIINAIIGIILIILSYVIISVIVNTLTSPAAPSP